MFWSRNKIITVKELDGGDENPPSGGRKPQVDSIGRWAEPSDEMSGQLEEWSLPDITDQDGKTSIGPRLRLDVPQFHKDGPLPILIFSV